MMIVHQSIIYIEVWLKVHGHIGKEIGHTSFTMTIQTSEQLTVHTATDKTKIGT